MVASSASVSSEPCVVKRRMLVVSPGWIGDALMSMPALQLFQAGHPDVELTVLAKAYLLPLWEMHAAARQRLATGGTVATVRALLKSRFEAAYLLPNSVRSALLPWLAAVPARIGLAGHWRRWLLTRVVEAPTAGVHRHQAWEYAAILSPDSLPVALPLPCLEPPDTACADAARRVAGLPRPLIGLLPGAARGPAKRWPAERFAEVGRMLREKIGGGILVMGGTGDAESCARVTAGMGSGVQNLAGATTLPEWAALLKLCDVVICNDSGGMHLAAAVGAPVVAVFGITDPARTGPLGSCCRVLQHSQTMDRAVPRDSPAAVEALAAVGVDEVVAAALEVMKSGERHA